MTLLETAHDNNVFRKYLPINFDVKDATAVKSVLLKLSSEVPFDILSAKKWFGLFCEVSAALIEAQTEFELALQLDVTNNEVRDQLKKFEENILSEMLAARHGLITIYLNSPWKFAMHSDDKGRFEKDLKNRQRYSDSSLVSLQLQENQIIREYRRWYSQAETEFRGRTMPLSVVVGKQSDSDESTRKEAFFSHWNFIKKNEGHLQKYFQDLFDNRTEQAKIVKAQSYADIAFSELGRIDYTIEDCQLFRDSIYKHIVPIVSELSKHQSFSLKQKSVKPWNLASWPQLQPSSKPANGDISKFIIGFENILLKIHPQAYELYKVLSQKKHIDIFPSRNKSPGAFTVTFPESGLPFIFGNFSATQRDAFTFIHEFGHAIHGYFSSHIENTFLRTPGLEFCELAAIGLELLAFPHLEEWWGSEASSARSSHLFSLLHFWPFMAMIDEFQHVVYQGTESTASARNSLWQKLSRKYRPHLDWSDCEDYEALGWFGRQHIFTSPFYYIDYGIAQLGALQLWINSFDNYSGAVTKYFNALGLGAQRSLPELFEVLGADIQFSGSLIEELAKAVKSNILRNLEYI